MSIIDPACQAVIFDPKVAKGTKQLYDAPDIITLTHYSPNQVDYKVSSPVGGLAAFSEIFYPAGWKAFIDGKKAEIFRVDYLLRGLNVEAG